MTFQDNTFLDLLDRCYASVEDNSAWGDFIAGLTHALDSNAGDFTLEDYAGGSADPLGTIGFDPGFRVEYDVSFLGENPWFEQLARLPRKRAFASELEPDDFETSPYYNEWVRPQGFRHAMGALIHRDNRKAIHIGFLRNLDHEPFSVTESCALDRLLPHVHRALDMRDRLKPATDLAGPLEAVVEQLRIPAFLLGPGRQLLRCNALAEGLIGQDAEFSHAHNRLSVWTPGAAKALDAGVANACQLDVLLNASERTEITIPRRNDPGPPYVADIIPVRSADSLLSNGPCCLVLLTDPSAGQHQAADVLHSLWGLTPSEISLATALCDGISLAEHAERCGNSVGTVRWHMKNVQAKIGVHSATAVVARVQAALRRF